MDVKERLLEFIHYKRMTVSQFHVEIGVSNAYVANMSKSIGTKALQKIEARFPELNVDWLLKGEGEMLNLTAKLPNVKMIKVVPMASCGVTLDSFLSPDNSIECENIIQPVLGAELAIVVNDDKMAPEYPMGCKIFVKRIDADNFINWGSDYVLDTKDGILFGKLFPSSEDDRICCKSCNAKYPDVNLKKDCVLSYYKVLAVLCIK